MSARLARGSAVAARAVRVWCRAGAARARVWYREGVAATRALGALALPSECPVCGAETEGESAGVALFCAPCRAELCEAAGTTCPRCARSVGPWADVRGGCSACRKRPLGFDAAVALGPYQGPIRDLCLLLKDARNGWVGHWLGRLLADVRPAIGLEAAGGPGAVVVPVPLHWRRRLARRYNQSDRLAEGLARRLGLPVVDALRRVAQTPVLAKLGRAERQRLLHDAFRARPRRSASIKGRTVLLVDDVLTTGATCGAAARALKRAGATRVVAVVIGRTEGR